MLEVYFSYTDIRAGHRFWRNALLGLKQLPAITGQFNSPDCNATVVSYDRQERGQKNIRDVHFTGETL
jgi:hypothetical protein